MNEKNSDISLAKFGKPFQETLAQLILDDSMFADQVGEVLKSSFFELKYLQEFTKLIYSYKEEFSRYPSRATFESVLRSEIEILKPTIQKQVRDFYARILSNKLKEVNEEYVKEKSIDFCKKQTLKEAMLKSVQLMEKSSFDEIQEVIGKALKLGTDNEQGYEFIKHFESRYVLRARNPVSTGWEVIDGFIQGGLGKGELGVVIAPTGSGKSMAMVHLGAAALKAGKNIVHYTLELQDTVVGKRYDSCLTGFPLNSLNDLKDEVFEQIKEIKGQLLIKEYPTKSASVMTIRSHLTKVIQRGFEVDLIIIDYGDLLKPTRHEREKRNELESIYEEMRGLAGEFSCPTWTCSQTNRSGLNAEVVTMESISEAFNKCFVADFIFSLSRTVADKQCDSGRIFIAKNRNGADGIVCPIRMDTSRVDIEVFEPSDDSLEEIQQNGVKKQKLRLDEKYKAYMEEKNKKEKKL